MTPPGPSAHEHLELVEAHAWRVRGLRRGDDHANEASVHRSHREDLVRRQSGELYLRDQLPPAHGRKWVRRVDGNVPGPLAVGRFALRVEDQGGEGRGGWGAEDDLLRRG